MEGGGRKRERREKGKGKEVLAADYTGRGKEARKTLSSQHSNSTGKQRIGSQAG